MAPRLAGLAVFWVLPLVLGFFPLREAKGLFSRKR
jgi:hypothetical protein